MPIIQVPERYWRLWTPTASGWCAAHPVRAGSVQFLKNMATTSTPSASILNELTNALPDAGAGPGRRLPRRHPARRLPATITGLPQQVAILGARAGRRPDADRRGAAHRLLADPPSRCWRRCAAPWGFPYHDVYAHPGPPARSPKTGSGPTTGTPRPHRSTGFGVPPDGDVGAHGEPQQVPGRRVPALVRAAPGPPPAPSGDRASGSSPESCVGWHPRPSGCQQTTPMRPRGRGIGLLGRRGRSSPRLGHR